MITKTVKNLAAALVLTIAVSATAATPTPAMTGHFAWGAEAGGSIDMTSNDMSTLNLDAFFGYRNSFLQMLGVGAGIHVMVNNSCRSFPVYAMMRTNFRRTPSLCFFDLRAGCAINNVNADRTQTRLYLAPSLGINLARSSTFTSYVMLGYEYNGMHSYVKDDQRFSISDGLSMAMVKIGITF